MEMRNQNEEDVARLDELTQVTEALVFAADEPVGPERIAQAYAEIRGQAQPERAEIDRAVNTLNDLYERTGHSFRIYTWADGLRMATVPEISPFLKAFLNEQRTRRLSRSLMEALAVVAYKQPVTKPEVDFIRGVDSDYALRKLMEVDMVDVVGRSDAVGRPLLYGTTGVFLEKFGLENLENLPNLREVEELLSDPAFNSERARLLLRESLFDAPAEQEDEPAPAGTEDRADSEPVSGLEKTTDVDLSPAADEVAHTNGNGRNGR